jgi:hypothetical protein
MKLTYWVNKGLKGEKRFEEEFDSRHDLLAPIYGEAILERCFWLGKGYDTEFDMHVYVLNKKELKHALEYLVVLVCASKSKKITGLWYALNRELYDDGFKILVVAFEYE